VSKTPSNNPPRREPTAQLPIVDSSGGVPVFDCRVLLSKLEDGRVEGRVANLAGIAATANTERDLLRKLVDQFKKTLLETTERGEPIPWIDPPEAPRLGESQRWIPVHL